MSKKLEKEQFEEPKIIATYEKDELEEVIRPHLAIPTYGITLNGVF